MSVSLYGGRRGCPCEVRQGSKHPQRAKEKRGLGVGLQGAQDGLELGQWMA